jgi:murein DD-endopeptidase MepM/ murein hydrolase activator NlpD
MYAHMSSFGSYNVGDDVKRGDVIGYVGRTGLGTGYHLHFEYQINGSAHNPRLLLPI